MIATHLLSDVLRLDGMWWKGDAPEKKVPGALTWHGEHADLDLHVALDGTGYGPIIESSNYSTLHGFTRDGRAVTILDSATLSRHITIATDGSHFEHEIVRSKCVLIGENVLPRTTFTSASFYVPGLQVWLSKQCVSKPTLRQLKNGTKKITFAINRYLSESYIPTSSGMTIHFELENEIDQLPWSLSVDAKACIRFESDVGQELAWFLSKAERVTSLISLLAGTPMGSTGIQVGSSELPNEVSVLVALNTPGVCTLTQPGDFFLLRKELGRRFGNILDNWLKMPLQLERASQLALSAINSGKVWPHVALLSLTQALEGFHRGISDGKYMDASAYDDVYKHLISKIPVIVGDSHRQSLKSRLLHGNEISLRNRLKELSLLVSPSLRANIFGPKGKVPNAWVDTRNYFTHWDESTKDNVLDGPHLYSARLRMQMLLRVLYLQHVGVKPALLAGTLGRDSQVVRNFQWAVQFEKNSPH